MVKVGANEYIPLDNITQVASPDSLFIKKLMKKYRDENSPLFYDYRNHKGTKCVILTKFNELIVTFLTQETILSRMDKRREEKLETELKKRKEFDL